jgi:hypothetical protein
MLALDQAFASNERESSPGPPPDQRYSAVPSPSSRHSYQAAASPIQMPTSPTQPAGANLQRSNTSETMLAVLRRFDTVLLIDDSASMRGLWMEAMQAVRGLVEVRSSSTCILKLSQKQIQRVTQYDADGIDIYFLCSPAYMQNCRTPHQAESLFNQVQPLGENTPTETRVEELLSPYVDQCENAKKRGTPLPKPLNMLVITDGQPDDPDTLAYGSSMATF